MKKIAAVIITDTHLKESNIKIVVSIFRQAISFCLENKIDTIYHLGDIFDSRKSQPLLILNTFREILDEVHSNEISLVAICGNHEKTSYNEVSSFLHPFLHHPAFVLIDSYFKMPLTENVTVHFLPFFADDIYNEMLKLVQIDSIISNHDILFTHIGISGARMNNGQIVEGIAKSSFEMFEFIISGHYHDKQIFDKFNYIGSTIQHNYGETPDKGLTVLYNDLTWETVELEFPRYHKIEVDVDKLTNSEIEEIKKVKEETGDNLRVILVGSEAKVKSFNKQLLLNEGISVEHKIEEVVKEQLEERTNPFTSTSLVIEFEKYCKKNNLNEKEGKKYLYLVVN